MLAVEAPENSRKIIPQDLVAGSDSQALQVLLNQLSRRGRGIYEINLLGAAADRLNAHCACAGKKIRPNAAFEGLGITGRENVKQGFAQAVGGGTDIGTGQRPQRTPPVFAGDHAHGSVPYALYLRLFAASGANISDHVKYL